MNSLLQMIKATSIQHHNLIKRLAAPLQQHIGASYFCYQFVSHEGNWFTLGNNPDWLQYCAENKFYKHDPSLVRPERYVSSVCLPANHQHQAFQETLVGKAITQFNINHALALIEPNSHGCEYYFFAAPSSNTNMLECYMNYLTILRNEFTHYVQDNIRPIYEHCLAHSVNLQELSPAEFNSTDNVLTTCDTLHEEADFLKAIKCGGLLTERENECLRLYLQGYTAKESARKLAISHRTIEVHFESIKNKLGIKHKRDLLK